MLQRCASVSVLPRLQPVGLLPEGDVVGSVERCEGVATSPCYRGCSPDGLLPEGDVFGSIERCEGVATSCVGVRVTEVASPTGCCETEA